MQTISWARRCAALLVGVFSAAVANATDYVTTLTLQQPGAGAYVEQVEFRWSTGIAGGAVGTADLDNFSVRILQAANAGDCVIRNANCTQIYVDNMIEDGVVQPIGGAARAPGEILWAFEIGGVGLSQFRNAFGSINASSGVQYQIEDGASLQEDGQVRFARYLDGSFQTITVGQLLFQDTVIAPVTQTAVTPVGGTNASFIANLTHGWQFTPAEDITLTSLGWSDPGGNGLAASHEVGLFHVDNATPIITVNVTNASALRNGYRYEAIPPTRLSAGETYVIAGYDPGGAADPYAVAPLAETLLPPEVGYVGYVSRSGATGLALPNTVPNPEIACCARWAVNFEFRSGDGLAFGRWRGGNATPPSAVFSPRGVPAVTTVLADGATGQAVLGYDNNTNTNTGGAAGAWQFSTIASANGSLPLDYRYNGFHAFFGVRVNLEVFVIRDGAATYTTLVAAGPVDCDTPGCTPPSGGFNYAGSTSVNVQAGDEIGFRLAGSNGDAQSRLSGTLSVTADGAVVIGSPLPDRVINEDDPAVIVDLSTAFSPAAELSFSASTDNPDLFDAIDITGSTLTLTPATDKSGFALVEVTALSSSGLSAGDSFLVTVNPVNDPPQLITPLPDLELELGSANPIIDLAAYFDDVDIGNEGDSLSYTAVTSNPGVVSFTVVGSALELEGVGVGTTSVTVTAIDTNGATATGSFDVTTFDPEFFGSAVLIQAVTGFNPETGENAIAVAINATGLPGSTTQTVELLTSSSCSGGALGEDAVVFAEVVIPAFDENGEAYLTSVITTPAPIGTYASARIRGSFSSGESDGCSIAGPNNDSWLRALDLPLTASGDVSTAEVTGFLDREGRSRWYRFQIQPGARVSVDLSSLPEDYDLFLFKDIRAVFEDLEGDNDVEGLNRLGAEFAPSMFAPSQFAPSVFAPSQFAPDAYAPSQFAPSQFAPSMFAPSQFAPSMFAPSQFAPSMFAPSQFAPSQFAPSQFAPSQFAPSQFAPSQFASENFASAQIRSLVAVSATTGTGAEQTVADTWNNTGAFYIRVSGKNGAFDVEDPFELNVEIDGVDCTGVTPELQTVSAGAGDYRSIILWDSARVANDPSNTPSQVAALEANLQTLASRPEVNGLLLDLAGLTTIQGLHDQADRFTSCPYAENLTATAIKGVIDAYREANPNMAYVVLVGSDSHIPFFRYPDQGLLGPEQDYNPPVSDGTHSQSALRLNYILGQDEYGAAVSLSLRDGNFPVPGLAVGRLVETAADMNAVLDAYLATTSGVIDRPESTLVTGYDFLTDAADEVQNELVLGTGGVRNDTLITDADISPEDERSWTADDLRRELLDEGEDIVFLAGHFSANSALAADYSTTTLTTELDAADTEFTNAIIFSAGCHSGYNIVNEDIVPGVTEPLDWTQAFARKGATLIAGTGYQYGDTDFVEYGERLYVGFAQQLRTGSGPVSVGQAMVRAKQHYLATTPDIRGLHRKSIIISTIFGLPMLSVDMPGQRLIDEDDQPSVTPQLVKGDDPNVLIPGEILGLHAADISFGFNDGEDGAPEQVSVPLTGLDGISRTAIYYKGRDGVVTNPVEPALPLYTRNVTPVVTDSSGLLSLRGVGLRGGVWNESTVLPLTGAPTTELRGVHTPFTSPVYFPMRLANSNYYNALSGGGTTLLHVTPAQHRSEEIGDIESVLRLFSSLDFRLYYSGNTETYGPNLPALAGPPTMSGVQGEIDGNDIIFSVNVVGDAAAAIHEVWVTHTVSGGASGEWVSLDLVQDPVDSTLWSATLENAVGPPRDYVVQAVSGTGLVNIDDNFGAYYKIPAVEPGAPPPEEVEPAATEIVLYAPTIGSYGDELSVTASLSSELFPVEDANVVFTVGGSGRVARTDASGNATVQLPLTAPPGDYTITASYAGNEELEPASAEALITITPTGTLLSLFFDEQNVGVEGIEPGVTAKLTDESGRPLLQRTVYFTLQGGPEGLITLPVITNNTGFARLPALQLPPGDYSLTARFLGVIPTPDGSLELDDPIYGPSIASDSLALSAGCEPGALDAVYAPGNGKGKGKSKGGATPAVVGFCYLDQDVPGKVTIQDGTLVVGAGVEVGGKIEQFGAGSVRIRPQARVIDKIVEVGPGSVEVFGEAADKVEESGPGDLVIHTGATVAGKAVEAGPGQLTVSGKVGDRVAEQDDGNLVITTTGEVAGKAEESGPGTVFNDGWVSGPVRED